ncbi:heavy metal-associated isoprenylated plant protein 19 [Gastrolobium bilobum]|uniref:heavy metal-associated isoprenylated plant protein 19 n=1 Tax=Gastrolobium bilobum TaxID=150636 RepID=UPI002AB26C4E|nr:heavy metal-associated isoprenylated plant protein 19 [Gastrolobium bilobum]
MPFGLSKVKPIVGSVNSNPMSTKYCCMVMRINIDCNSCCRKLRRIILRMKGIETNLIEKQQRTVYVCGRFIPAEVAIKIKKKMNRRVEILEIQELEGEVQEFEGI